MQPLRKRGDQLLVRDRTVTLRMSASSVAILLALWTGLSYGQAIPKPSQSIRKTPPRSAVTAAPSTSTFSLTSNGCTLEGNSSAFLNWKKGGKDHLSAERWYLRSLTGGPAVLLKNGVGGPSGPDKAAFMFQALGWTITMQHTLSELASSTSTCYWETQLLIAPAPGTQVALYFVTNLDLMGTATGDILKNMSVPSVHFEFRQHEQGALATTAWTSTYFPNFWHAGPCCAINVDGDLDNVDKWSGNPVSAVQFNNPTSFKVVRALDVL